MRAGEVGLVRGFLRGLVNELAAVRTWRERARVRRRRRDLARRFQSFGPLETAAVVVRAIEQDAELRRRVRRALGINMKGRAR